MSLGKRRYLVEDVMTRSPVTVKPTSTVWEAVLKMDELDVGAMPVVDEYGRLVGIFTERDLLRRVVAKGRDPRTTLIRDVMTPSPVSISPKEPIEVARSIMANMKVRHLPVVNEEGKLVGIISIRDLELVEV